MTYARLLLIAFITVFTFGLKPSEYPEARVSINPTLRGVASGANFCNQLFVERKFVTTREEFDSGNLILGQLTESFSFQLADKTFITVVNLANVKSDSVEAKSAKNYLLHRDQIYAQRLKIFDDEHLEKITTTQTIDQQVATRSLLIMNTKNPITRFAATEFIGGARVVLAKSDQALLPFQLGLGISRNKIGSIAAEIGALTAYTKDNPNKSVEVINAAIKLAVSYAQADQVYVHTSRLHSRLYKKMNLDADETLAIDDLNYILRFDAKNWQSDAPVTKSTLTVAH